MTKWFWTCFSQLSFLLWSGVGFLIGSTAAGGSTDSFISEMLSTCKIENRLCADAEGVQVTCHLVENPPPLLEQPWAIGETP